MKVIRTDNFDRDWISDGLVQSDMEEVEAEALAAELNAKEIDPHTPNYFRAVPDDYELLQQAECFLRSDD
jgi:hypothetical protein